MSLTSSGGTGEDPCMAVAPASSHISFDKSLIKVVLLENVHRSAVEALRAE